jgi:hypothetical protein
VFIAIFVPVLLTSPPPAMIALSAAAVVGFMVGAMVSLWMSS